MSLSIPERLKFLRSRPAQFLTVILIVQGCMIGVLAPAEQVPLSRPLAKIPTQLEQWRMYEESPIEPEIMELLKANDTLNRTYIAPDGTYANLFIAFFKSQRAGVAPHSPKVCLPGSGWVPTESSKLDIPIPGRDGPIHVNRYIVSKGDERSLIIYWYQTPYRVIAGEFTAKFYTMVDGLRYHRSDTSLVRVIVSIRQNEDLAEQQAVRFIQGFFNPVREFLPL
jgi:EpsI family protein